MNTPKIKKEKSGAAGGHRSLRMVAVTDTRKHKVRGLWIRNGRYYVQFRHTGEDGKSKPTKMPLMLTKDGAKRPPQNLDEARQALEAFRTELRAGKINVHQGRESLRLAIEDYLAEKRGETEKEAKNLRKRVESGQVDVAWKDKVWKPSYLLSCTRILGGKIAKAAGDELEDAPARGEGKPSKFVPWVDYLEGRGVRKLRDVKPVHVDDYMTRLRAQGLSNATQNMYLTVFRKFIARQVEKERLAEGSEPTRKMKNVDPAPPKTKFLEAWHVDRLVEAARRYGQNGEALAQLIRLLELSGMRKMEALRLRWEHVDFEKGELNVGMDGLSKSGKFRVVPLTSDKLRQHLEYMHENRDPFSPWLFPSPKRGDNPKHAHWQNPYGSWNRLRAKASVPDPAYPEDFDQPEARRRGWLRLASTVVHDLRHRFISVCVHAGINYMTIAEIVGHEDGGVLIGERYGHVTSTINADHFRKLNVPAAPVAAQA